MSYTLVARSYFQSVAKLDDLDLGRLEDFIRRIEKDPEHPGLGIERVPNAVDDKMCWARLSPTLRAVIRIGDGEFILLYVAQEAEALEWGTRHRVCRHPVTGRLQTVPTPPDGLRGRQPKLEPGDDPLVFARFDEEYLIALGVPPDWASTVRAIDDEESFWHVHQYLPEEVAEALYALALGEEVDPPAPVPTATGQIDPDSKRRYAVTAGSDDLQALLGRHFEEWMLYLHPAQRSLVEQQFNGPAKVTGSAGTGKTVVAVHRAFELARAGADVLLTTYTNRLREGIQAKVIRLTHGTGMRGSIDVETTYRFALSLCREAGLKVRWAKDSDMKSRLEQRYRKSCGFDIGFVCDEWESVIAQNAILEWAEYREIQRTGRGVGLQPSQREQLWKVFEPVIEDLRERSIWPWGHLCRFAREALENGAIQSRYDAVVVDEVQDLSTQAIRMLAAVPRGGLSHFMIVGDAGQRIYPGGFSLRSMGIETRGRSRQLTINYRTTHEIERAAAQLRGLEIDDLEGEHSQEPATQSLLRGPKPALCSFTDRDDEALYVATQIRGLVEQGVRPKEIAVFGRTWAKLARFRRALRELGVPCSDRRDDDADRNEVKLSTMHGAKGLEFRFAFVVGMEQNALPLKSVLKTAQDAAELQVVTDRERNLLYVSMTRARDNVWITWSGDRSPFIDAIEPASELVAIRE